MADYLTLGAALGGGAVSSMGTAALVWLFPRLRQGTFPRWRLTPYLQAASPVSRLSPNVWARLVQVLGSSRESVRRRLALAGSDLSVRDFRLRQAKCFVLLVSLALGLILFALEARTLSAPGAIILLSSFAISGVMLPDYLLSAAAKRRQMRLSQELPDAIELLALAVGAGESLYAALGLVAKRCTQVTGQELLVLMGELNEGVPMAPGLTSWRARTDCEILTHLVDAIVSALERGSPLAGVLREQVADSRAQARTQLLAQGGKKEVWMMVPVVFLILPLTVVFALYPGLVALQM